MTGSSRSDNARRHGVLARPNEQLVMDHLRDILGEPAPLILPGALSERELAALELAEAEVQVDRAQAHYVECQGVERIEDLDDGIDHLADLICFDWVDDATKAEAARRIFHCDRFAHRTAWDRRRLASRYLREATARRDRALRAFHKL